MDERTDFTPFGLRHHTAWSQYSTYMFDNELGLNSHVIGSRGCKMAVLPDHVLTGFPQSSETTDFDWRWDTPHIHQGNRSEMSFSKRSQGRLRMSLKPSLAFQPYEPQCLRQAGICLSYHDAGTGSTASCSYLVGRHDLEDPRANQPRSGMIGERAIELAML